MIAFIPQIQFTNSAQFVVAGVMANLGSGTGGLLAALIIESFTWRHYFYCIGAIYILGLVLHLLFVQTSPENSWLV